MHVVCSLEVWDVEKQMMVKPKEEMKETIVPSLGILDYCRLGNYF